jgi:hypothetical protein
MAASSGRLRDFINNTSTNTIAELIATIKVVTMPTTMLLK